MTRKTDIPLCAWCSTPLPPAKKTGRPRRYCNETCRLTAFRHKQLVAAFDGAPIEPLSNRSAAAPAPGVNTDEQVARAVLEAKNLAGAFHRLGLEARPQFAWRASGMAQAIQSALVEFFEEALR